ncbi:hypothetical protein BCV70DRAFT_202967 [Testicularia cyperi]|uniref:Uncharacterized protein n=1 Tax=Testicularia cyperi TaxID=1882483 RepID=A0A317XGL2_9BASI|nr:hypothetical protein BCV70DRAFT_202967 [Testicularia cyperi]
MDSDSTDELIGLMEPLAPQRSSCWYDDEAEADADADSLSSADSDDTVVTCPDAEYREDTVAGPVASPGPQPDESVEPTVSGWRWSQTWPSAKRTTRGRLSIDVKREQTDQDGVVTIPISPKGQLLADVARHPSSHRPLSVRNASGTYWKVSSQDQRQAADADERDSDEDSIDVVGFTSYPSHSPPRSPERGEPRRTIVPFTLHLEEESSSDESEDSSCDSHSSSGSDPEARRRASVNMLQRLGMPIRIPKRQTSMQPLGHGPRRPPSLDQITSRIGGSSSTGYGSSALRRCPSTLPHSRSVSCPSPVMPYSQLFGQVEIMITPPTPQMSSGRIPGVVLKSPNLPTKPFMTDGEGKLIAPHFDVAPGKQIILRERERQAQAWLDNFHIRQRQETERLKMGAGAPVPPLADGAVAQGTFATSRRGSTETTTTVCATEPQRESDTCASSGANRVVVQAPPIPPRRRSFCGKKSPPLRSTDHAATDTQASTPVVPSSPVVSAEVATASGITPTERVAAGRSLVARLSLRRNSSGVAQKRGASLLIPRKPVTSI